MQYLIGSRQTNGVAILQKIKSSYVTIGSWQNLAKAKFMNLKMDNRLIENKPSTKLLGAHIDEKLTWDNQIKHISTKFSLMACEWCI